jgi:hypothetical protein
MRKYFILDVTAVLASESLVVQITVKGTVSRDFSLPVFHESPSAGLVIFHGSHFDIFPTLWKRYFQVDEMHHRQ